MKLSTLSARVMQSVGLALSIVLAASMIAMIPAGTAAASPIPAPHPSKPVPGHHARPLTGKSRKSESTSSTTTPAPKGATYTLTAPLGQKQQKVTTRTLKGNKSTLAIGAWRALGKTGISVATSEPKASATSSATNPAVISPTEKGAGDNVVAKNPAGVSSASAAPLQGGASSTAPPVKVRILSQHETESLGYHGIAFQLSVASESAAPSTLAIKLSRKLLASRYGADFATRLHWTQVVEGSTTRSDVASSLAKSDGATILTPKVGQKVTTLAALASPVSTAGTGSFAATPYNAASAWQVSAQTGDFAWSVPLRIPTAAAGPAPDLSLKYDSQAVDGETSSTNNQSSAIGEGWDLGGGGFIQRNFASCAHDETDPVAGKGDLCWRNDNVTLNLNGHSGPIVKDSATGTWKLQADDGTTITRLTSTSVTTGCGNTGLDSANVCWLVTTTDGTKYYFGKNHLPGWTGTSTPATNSTWYAPVYGNSTGEPCHASTFAASKCNQAWKWNLDYVVDPHGNAEALYYDSESNKYEANGTTLTSYIRGGQLDHIDYGIPGPTAAPYSAANVSDRVKFAYDQYGRCSYVPVGSGTRAGNCTDETITNAPVTTTHAGNYPDVPFDQFCSSSCATIVSPSFWTTAQLNSITTSAKVSGALATVDKWTLTHTFPSTGDGTSPALWLSTIKHAGTDGTTSEPAMVFSPISLPNKVDTTGGDVYLRKQRLASIDTAPGARIAVTYSNSACDASDAAAIRGNEAGNTRLCYPQWWYNDTTGSTSPIEDIFQKYVVKSVVSDPRTGGALDIAQETDYDYSAGTPAWRYDASIFTRKSMRTWSIFAGFDTVRVNVGNPAASTTQASSVYSYFQGKDKDHSSTAVWIDAAHSIRDSVWYAGRIREVKTFASPTDTVPLTDSLKTPEATRTATPDADDVLNVDNSSAYMVDDHVVAETDLKSDGSLQQTVTTTTFDGNGFPTQVQIHTPDAGDTCTTTTYLPVSTQSIVGLTQEVKVTSTLCGVTPTIPDDIVSDTRYAYEGGASGDAATVGNLTETDVVDSYSTDGLHTPHWLKQNRTTFDTLGRLLTQKDALDHTTTSTYTPAAGGPLTSSTSSNALSPTQTTTTTYDPHWGEETKVVDPNGNTTTATYDALGRRVGVWLATRPYVSFPSSPSIAYTYTTPTNASGVVSGPNVIKTSALGPLGTLNTYDLYDGLGRALQTQSGAEGGGTEIADTFYDSLGKVSQRNNPYWTTSVGPSGTLFIPTNQATIPSQTFESYDGAGRLTTELRQSYGAPQSSDVYSYSGFDRTDFTPPAGGTPTTTFANTVGETTKLVQYLSSTVFAGAPQETTTYTYDARGAMLTMKDPAANTWSWTYDQLGRRTGASDPDAGTTTTGYDGVGEVTTTTDARNVTRAYAYDAIGRKTAEYADAVGITGKLLKEWHYDTVSSAKGQLASSTSYTGSIPGNAGLAYTETVTGYDAMYRPLGTTLSIPTGAPAFGGTSYTNSTTYNAAGSVDSYTDTALGSLPAETIRPDYDAFGNVFDLAGASTYASSVLYTPIGQVSDIQRQISSSTTSLETAYGYDVITGAVSQIQNRTTLSGITKVAKNEVFTYDKAGDVTKLAMSSDTTSSDTQCFSYDHLQNLTEAWTPANSDCTAAASSSTLGGIAPYWNSYTIDPDTGNRTAAIQHAVGSTPTASSAYHYPAAGATRPHGVLTVDKTIGTATTTDHFGYDNAGNTNARDGQTLQYNEDDAEVKIDSGATTEAKVYDAGGTLILQSDPTNGSTLYLGDSQLHLAGTVGTSSATRTYSLNGTPIAERTAAAGSSTSVLQWASADAQNTVGLLVDFATGSLSVRSHDPFGKDRGTVPSWPTDRGFLDAPTSTLTSLVQLGGRVYDSNLGRFLSLDPIMSPATPQQNNGYSYAHNNPVSMSDPSGAEPAYAGCDTKECRDDWYGGSSSGKSKSGPTSSAAGNTKLGFASSQGSASNWYVAPATIAVPLAPAFPGINWAGAGDALAGFGMAAVRFAGVTGVLLTVLSMSGDSTNAGAAREGAHSQAAAGAAGPPDCEEVQDCLQLRVPNDENVPDLKIVRSQIEKKFDDHAEDFGVTLPRGRAGFEALEKGIKDFVDSPSTIRVFGKFHNLGEHVINYNPASRLIVVQKVTGEFVTGYQLNEYQLARFLEDGSVGILRQAGY